MTQERNWAENFTYSAERVARPQSTDELRDVIRGGGQIRAIGSRHCFNDIADTTGTLISLAELPREIEVTGDSVKFSGGLRYGDIAPVLQEHGRALANLASLPHISVAGAIATGTHGSGDKLGSLATAVRSITFVTSEGDEVVFEGTDTDFGGAPVHLGALGIVTELELATEPSYDIAQHTFDGPRWADVLSDYDAVTGLGDSVSLFTTWRDTERADQLWVKTRGNGVDERVVSRLGAVPADGARHPILGVDPIACNPQRGVKGPWFERLPHFRMDFTPSVGAELQSEFLIAREDAPAAIEAISKIAHVISPLLFVNEIRSVAASELWLDPAYGRDSVALHFTWHRDEPAVRAVLVELEAALAPFGARPHWGKVYTTPGEAVAALYPRFDDFRELRAKLDPAGRLLNEYSRRIGL
ncbi:xylitol oxidase [Microbacterium sorbitolivorans]|uniref:FAD-binding protein n=1 Tax=Microbacterium sorbitolivorans TaxID=1867410 RepID=A0A367Y6U5_9MICO|nr:D-arabinono-1,4-lactone oxidase [Microbacterium sorbitolivorans]RCK61330.1 FAD-binding protein [Microbacterium sorbitolivorans]GGF33127.1 xylitol oxidase [Microbacterium sorbitolivorans]